MRKQYDLKKMKIKKRGPLADPKASTVPASIKLDLDIASWLLQKSERTRIPYETLVNSLLKEAMDRESGALRELIKKVIQEELMKK